MTSLVDLLVEAFNLATLVAIGVGIAAGVLAVMLTRSSDPHDNFDSELTDLEERRAHGVAQLRELELQRSKIDPETYEQQKAEHERMAADALRARDELLKRRGKAKDNPRPAWRGVTWAAGLVLFHGIMLWVVSPDEIPPANAMATDHAASVDAVSPELAEVWQQLQRNPADVDALARGASLLAAAGRLEDARQYVERALQLDPEHPWALLEYAALLANNGRAPEALARLDKLVEKHPKMHEAWSLRSMIAMQTGDMEKARASLEAYMKAAPEGETKTQIRSMLEAATAPGDGSPPASADGAGLWAAQCDECHGTDGTAQTGMGRALAIPDLTTPEWQNTTDEHIRETIRKGVVDENGRQRMPAFSDLSDGQLQALIAHIRSLVR